MRLPTNFRWLGLMSTMLCFIGLYVLKRFSIQFNFLTFIFFLNHLNTVWTIRSVPHFLSHGCHLVPSLTATVSHKEAQLLVVHCLPQWHASDHCKDKLLSYFPPQLFPAGLRLEPVTLLSLLFTHTSNLNWFWTCNRTEDHWRYQWCTKSQPVFSVIEDVFCDIYDFSRQIC